jgi:hypothetical protein
MVMPERKIACEVDGTDALARDPAPDRDRS